MIRQPSTPTHQIPEPVTAITATRPASAAVTLAYDSATHALDSETPFDIGRDADLVLDENPYLHRRSLRLIHESGFWWLVNIGSRIAATVTDADSGMSAWLPPGGRLPVVFRTTVVVLTAGPHLYELTLHNDTPAWKPTAATAQLAGATTLSSVPLTASQRLAIIALAEPTLRREVGGASPMPTNADAARRLGWALTRFNRKLDNVCDKLDRFGVDGVHGGAGSHATQRRARLIEYAVSTGLVTDVDLQLLDNPPKEEDPE